MLLRPHPHNTAAVALSQALDELLDPQRLPEDLCLVMGGDGHMLTAIHELGAEYNFLGLNCGRVGFLLNDWQSPEQVAERLNGGHFHTRSVHRLALTGTSVQGQELSATAVNDIYLERMSGQTAHLRVLVDGQQVVERMVCDGLVVATALGSTAYSMAAGGPACHPDLPMIELTPLAPHRPRLPTLVLPRSAVVEVQALDTHKRPVRAVCDGRDQDSLASVRIQDAGSDVRLSHFEGHHPTVALIRKLLSA